MTERNTTMASSKEKKMIETGAHKVTDKDLECGRLRKWRPNPPPLPIWEGMFFALLEKMQDGFR